MITRKLHLPPKATVWPFTPDPSPRLLPVVVGTEVDEHIDMADEQIHRSRPISVAPSRAGVLSPVGRPTLDDVLNGRAPPPYTLAAYTAFLSDQHCLETLEFTVESRRYREKYDDAAAHLAGMPFNVDSDECYELQQDWIRILDVYVKPGAPREINLPAEERDDLVDYPYHTKPPPPEALEPALQRMYDLMSDSIFIPFCNSIKTVSYAHTYNPGSDFHREGDRLDPSRLTFDERGTMHQRKASKRRKSPQPTSHSSSGFAPSRSPPSQNKASQSSTLTSALGRAPNHRLSSHVSHSSVVSASESAVTDDSASDQSPLPFSTEPEVLSPPTTPPANELGSSMAMGNSLSPHMPKTQRSESGGWKKMSQKIWGNKKKNSSSFLRDRSEGE